MRPSPTHIFGPHGAVVSSTAWLIVLGICTACGGPGPGSTHAGPLATSPPASSKPQPLALTVRIRAERDGRQWFAASGDPLRTGDYFELLVHPNQQAYVYVMQPRPDGNSDRLFPTQGDRLLHAGREYVLPGADESFQLDPNDREERFYILMSRTPIADASALIPAAAGPTSASADASTVANTIAVTRPPDPPPGDQVKRDWAAPAPAAAGRRQPKPDIVPSIIRRVIRVKKPAGSHTPGDTTGSRDDEILTVGIHFQHV